MEEAHSDVEVGPGAPCLPVKPPGHPLLPQLPALSLPRVQSFPQSSQLTRETVRTLMSYALTAWAVESDLTFQEVSSQHQEPDILIDFSRGYHLDSYPFDGLGGTLAHAYFPGEHPISGDTHFDDEEIWTFGSKGKMSHI